MKTVILTHMGSPETSADIPDYLKRIFTDRAMIPLPFQNILGPLLAWLRIPETRRRYQKIGGGSPLPAITRSLAEKLSKELGPDGIRVEARYTHAHPLLKGDEEAVAIFPLYPSESMGLKFIRQRMPRARILQDWYNFGGILSCYRDRIKKALTEVKIGKATLLFLAHGLPLKSDGAEFYRQKVVVMQRSLAAFFPQIPSVLGFMGKAGPGKWLEPDAQALIKSMDKDQSLVAIYLSLPADNLEVSYDIDIELREIAEKAGVAGFYRAPLLNDDDDFVQAIAQIIRRGL